MNNTKQKIKLNPIMTLVLIIGFVILLSGVLSLFGLGASYNDVNSVTNTYETVWVSVESLFSLGGIKYIFQSTVSNFASFTPLSMLIIVLIGIGIMEKSGFLKTVFNLTTRNIKKSTITYVLVLCSIMLSICGDLGYVIMIPLSALLFLHGRRNPLIGMAASYAGLSCGTGLSVVFTSVDSSLLKITSESTHVLDKSFQINYFGSLFIMIAAILLLAFVISAITELIVADKVSKYEFKEEKKSFKLTKREVRGLILAIIVGFIYLFIFIYNIIPGVPFGGNFLDNTQELYIDKLFNPQSFFSQGFVFIVTMWFVLLGLSYGIGARTIKNHNDFCDYLSHSLDGIGQSIILILLSSVLINVFKKTNIGTVMCALLANLVQKSSFTGIPLLILFFICTAVGTFVFPQSVNKWKVMAGASVPVLMNAGFSPEFVQVVFRFAEGVTYGITPIMAYFVIYLAYIEKYNQEDEPIELSKVFKLNLKYSIGCGIVFLVILVLWYVIGLPIGINTLPTL